MRNDAIVFNRRESSSFVSVPGDEFSPPTCLVRIVDTTDYFLNEKLLTNKSLQGTFFFALNNNRSFSMNILINESHYCLLNDTQNLRFAFPESKDPVRVNC